MGVGREIRAAEFGAAVGWQSMSDDRHEVAHEATRRAVDAWITKGDDKAGKRCGTVCTL